MTRKGDWKGASEPRLDEVLRDPIVRALMRRDGVAQAEVETAALRLARPVEGAREDVDG